MHARILSPGPAHRRRILSTILLLGSLAGVRAQPYWVRDVGGAGNEHVAHVRTDTDGSIYVTGTFSGTAQFGGSAHVSSGAIDLFVAKLNAAGDVQWFKQGGGVGIDRGIKLAVGPAGTIAVVGEFMGDATLFGAPLTSAGGTTDMFVAVLNKSDGALQWIRQGGGADGADRPAGVSVAADGRVAVVGEFRGTATWEGSSLTSMVDGSGLPSVDVFVANYAPNGDLLWVKQGAAPATDQAVDVAHDAGGHIYVAGQFSHAITFGQTYANTLVNASFLLRLDPDGNDVWFRRFGGGVYNQVHAITWAPDGRLLLTGDLQGTMVFSGATSTNVAASQPFCYYILAVNTDGSLHAHTTRGSTSGVTVRGIAAHGGTVSVLGAFNCRFTDLAALHGAEGIFMAVGDQDLFIARHALAGLALQEGQQFGGASAKSPGALAAMPDGQLVFCGSFQRNLIFPAQPGFQADLLAPGGFLGNGVTTYCSDPNYGTFAASVSAGLADGFVARGYVDGRAPYDWWNRSGQACDRSPGEPCIQVPSLQSCVDTVRACGSTLLSVRMDYSYINLTTATFLGPPVTYQWSTGSTAASIVASTSGTYTVTITSQNGCWQWTDDIVVIIDPLPPFPLVHDDVVVNTGVPVPAPIELCDPQTQWAWSTGMPPGTTSWWDTPFSGTVMGDSVMVDTTGTYFFHVENEFGCARVVQLDVIDNPSVPMPDIGQDMRITFPQDTDLNDTLTICMNTWVEYTYTPNWTIDGLPVDSLPDGLAIFWGLAPNEPNIAIDAGPQGSTFTADSAGWQVLEVIVLVTNAPCLEDSLIFTLRDSIYIDLYPVVPITVDLTGPNVVCDGDTIVLTASCTCNAVDWAGPAFELLDPWSIAVWGPGMYGVSADTTDLNGCTYTASDHIEVSMPTGPVLQVDPVDGILCPGAVATITADVSGTDAVWFGPDGPISGAGSNLVTTEPGTYYLVLTVGGCTVVSNSVDLFAYSTPFIAAEPAPVLCFPGDEAVIQVMAAASAQVQWDAPLSGSAFTQTVTQAGTYTCTVTACGIATPLTVVVPYAPVSVAVSPAGTVGLCAGDTLQLHATGDGADDFIWLPSGTNGPSLHVTAGGQYQVVATNAEGCRDTSAMVVVQEVVFQDPLWAAGDTVCHGDMAFVTAGGSGTFTWYGDAGMTQPLGTGSPFGVSGQESITLYVQQTMLGCVGDTASVPVVVLPRPAPIVLDGPSALCPGEPFTLTFTAADTVTYVWDTPAGSFTGGDIHIPAVASTDAGPYACVPWYGPCSASPALHQLVVFVPVPIGLPDTVHLCLGGTTGLGVPPGFTQVHWSTGAHAPAITLTTGGAITVTAVDTNGCAVDDAAEVLGHDCTVDIPNVFSPNGDGTNDFWVLSGGFVNARTRIWNRWGGMVYQGDMATRGWDGRHQQSGNRCTDGVYYYEVEFVRHDGSSWRQAGYLHLQ
jgi:gliding motility-associated-like protein